LKFFLGFLAFGTIPLFLAGSAATICLQDAVDPGCLAEMPLVDYDTSILSILLWKNSVLSSSYFNDNSALLIFSLSSLFNDA